MQVHGEVQRKWEAFHAAGAAIVTRYQLTVGWEGGWLHAAPCKFRGGGGAASWCATGCEAVCDDSMYFRRYVMVMLEFCFFVLSVSVLSALVPYRFSHLYPDPARASLPSGQVGPGRSSHCITMRPPSLPPPLLPSPRSCLSWALCAASSCTTDLPLPPSSHLPRSCLSWALCAASRVAVRCVPVT